MAVNLVNIVAILTILLTITLQLGSTQDNDDVVDLQVNFASKRRLHSNTTTVFRIQGISDSIAFVLLQVHTQNTKVTLSLQHEHESGRTTVGSSVGAIAMVTNQSSVQFYVNTTHVTEAVVMAITYEKKSPIPGGCNTEFDLRLDPNLHLSWDFNEVTVSFQYADVSRGAGVPDHCEMKPYQSRLSYDIYQYFLPSRDWTEETFLQTTSNILTPTDIKKTATKIKTIEYGKGQTSVKFAAYPGQGVMFGVVVRELDLDNISHEAAYVPVSTYTCKFTGDAGCQSWNELPLQIIMCVLGTFGLILCFAGHRLFKFSMFTFGMLAAGLVSFILISRFTTLSLDIVLILTGVAGVVGGGLWLMLWCFVGVPVISVLLAGLVAGFIVSSAAFNLTPLGQLDIFKSEFNYGMSFSCGILIMPVLLLAFTKKLSLFSCTLVGSFLIMAAVDAFIKSYISFIVLDSVRKGSVEGFTKTLVTIPVQLSGILLLVAWGVLVLLGLILQTYMSRDQPDFPACPWDRYKERLQRNRQMEQLATQREADERQPLIGHRNRGRGLGSRTGSTPQFQETPPHEGYQALVDPL